MAEGPARGLEVIDAIRDEAALRNYPYLHSARADLLRRVGRLDEAVEAYRIALEHTHDAGDRAFLQARLAELRP